MNLFNVGFRQTPIMRALRADQNFYNANLSVLRRTEGPLSTDAVNKFFQRLRARHQALRFELKGSDTFFSEGSSWQPIMMSEVSIDQLLQAASDPFITSSVRKEGEPLCRLIAGTLADGSFFVGIVLSHLVSDAASLAVLRSDIDHLLTGSPPSGVPGQYGDFLDQEKRWFQSEAAKTESQFWFDYLNQLPRYSLGPGNASHQSNSTLRAVIKKGPSSLPAATVAVAAYAAGIGTTTGTGDAVMRTISANRSSSGHKFTVGNIATPFALRVRGVGTSDFADVLSMAQNSLREATARVDTFQLWNIQPELGRTTDFKIIFRGNRHRSFSKITGSKSLPRITLPTEQLSTGSGIILVVNEDAHSLTLEAAYDAVSVDLGFAEALFNYTVRKVRESYGNTADIKSVE